MSARRWLIVAFSDGGWLSVELQSAADTCRMLAMLAETIAPKRRSLASWSVTDVMPAGRHS